MWSLVHTLIAVLLGITLSTYLLARWLKYGHVIDLRYTQVTLPWVVLESVSYLLTLGWFEGYGRVVTRVPYQFLIFGVIVFLLTTINGRTGHGLPALIAVCQLVIGLACAPLTGPWSMLWNGVNVGATALLVLMLGHAIWSRTSAKSWMVLLMAVLGVGVMLADMHAAGDGPVRVTVVHDAYAIGLFVLWHALTLRSNATDQGKRALTSARRQLAQDLHDGVGAQLAGIILALDLRHPSQRATAVSLQHCLMDLKLLVDGADQEASALSHLACLRYRMQPLLEMMSIELSWNISAEDRLEEVRGDAAHQILHIAQEALANAMRHAKATQIAVTCGDLNDQREFLLEVADNGVGIPVQLLVQLSEAQEDVPLTVGKGLASMKQRAQRLGGYVAMDSAIGQGTRVRLVVPFEQLTQQGPQQAAH